MRADRQRHIGVPGGATAIARPALAPQAQGLAVGDAPGDLYLKIAAVGQRDAHRPAGRGLGERYVERVMRVGTPRPDVAPGKAVAALPVLAAQEFGEDVGLVPIAFVARPLTVGIARLLGEIAVVAALLRPFLPACVDLPPVEARPFLRVLQQIEGRRRRLEPRLGRRIAGMQVGMAVLGDLAIGLLDLIRAGILRDAKHVIGIVAHHFPAAESFAGD